jgi:hypothetical protein
MVLAAGLFASGLVYAQIPDKFTNLKVLPKDISKQELQSTMRGFAFALSVRCEHCHVEKKAPDKGLDFAADDKDAKKTARVMLQMVAAVNHDYISKVPKTAPIQVQCVTCHHGLTQPQPLNAVLAGGDPEKGRPRPDRCPLSRAARQILWQRAIRFWRDLAQSIDRIAAGAEKERRGADDHGAELRREPPGFRMVLSHASDGAPSQRPGR